jgi:hypothetical protein
LPETSIIGQKRCFHCKQPSVIVFSTPLASADDSVNSNFLLKLFKRLFVPKHQERAFDSTIPFAKSNKLHLQSIINSEGIYFFQDKKHMHQQASIDHRTIGN